MINIDCPRCKLKFEAEQWFSGECPTCKNKYWWDEKYAEDYYWIFVDWEFYV